MPLRQQKLGDNIQHIDCGQHGRQRSRSVSWNATGSWLAFGSSDRMAKIWTLTEGGIAREILSVSGHSAAIDRVRFHPTDSNLLLTSANDRTVRLWDNRGGSQRPVGRLDLSMPQRYGTCPASVEWGKDHLLVIAERNNQVHILDHRKLRSSNSGSRTTSCALKSFNLQPNVVEACQISPNGEYMIASTTLRGEGMGELRIWRYDADDAAAPMTYPGHTGPIYQFAISPDGKKLATGGLDAIVGLWDAESLICTNTITRRTKFIRSVAFSHDSQILACSTEEDGIDLSSNGEWLGTLYLQKLTRRGGADEISFHPKQNIVACARGLEFPAGMPNPPAVTICKFDLTSAV